MKNYINYEFHILIYLHISPFSYIQSPVITITGFVIRQSSGSESVALSQLMRTESDPVEDGRARDINIAEKNGVYITLQASVHPCPSITFSISI